MKISDKFMNENNHYPTDPRNPNPEGFIRTESSHPAHSNLKKIVVLLKLGDVYFITKGLTTGENYQELIDTSSYYYNEGTCPINFAGGFDMIIKDGDPDPHGVFEFVDAVFMTPQFPTDKWDSEYDCDLLSWLQMAFPQLKKFEKEGE